MSVIPVDSSQWQIHQQDHVASTQKQLLKHWQALPHGYVLYARTQSQGVGRNQNTWQSEPGGLYFSLLLKPTDFISALPWRVWLSLLEVLESYASEHLTLKASNDILYKTKKLAGFLIDAATQENHPAYYIVGCGLNLTQSHFPEEVLACTLQDISQQAFSQENVLHAVLQQLSHHLKLSEKQWQQYVFETHGHRQVRTAYEHNSTLSIKDYWNDTN